MKTKLQQKEQTHRQILDSAARLIRRRGISRTSVAEVMRGAGRTVGGFYAHFRSKDALVGETLRVTMRNLRSQLFADLDRLEPSERLVTVLRWYLSRSHRDNPAGGCALPAVVSEIAQGSDAAHEALASELAAFAEELEDLYPRGRNARSRQRGLATLALLFGGLTLARAVRGTPLSDQILQACRDYGGAALKEVAREAMSRACTTSKDNSHGRSVDH